MKLTINSKDLLKAVSLVGSLIKTPHTMPILENILFIVQGSKMMIVADNLEVRSQVEISVDTDCEISVCLPYKLLSSILKGFANEPIEFDFQEKVVSIKSATGTYNVPPVPAIEFPDNKKESGSEYVEINSWEFVRALKKATFFTDKDNSAMANLNNVLISISEEGTKVASTDKRVIFEYSLEAKGSPVKLMLSGSSAMYMIQSISTDEQIKLYHSGNHVILSLENREISAVLSDTSFPDYVRVIESLKMDKTLKIDRDVILPALKRLHNITDQKNHTLVFLLKDNTLELSFQHDLMKFDAVEKLVCDYDGQEIKIGFSANYLNNLLTAIEDDIVLELSTPILPCKITADNIRAILSPIRLN